MLKGKATRSRRANGAHVCLRHFQFVDFVLVVSGNLETTFRIRRQSATKSHSTIPSPGYSDGRSAQKTAVQSQFAATAATAGY